MKKLLAILFSAFMLGFSTASIAATGIAADQNGTGEGTTTTITAASDCTLLTEDVTVNLSSGVVGGYECVTSTNIIGVATCHPNGRKNGTANYIYTGSSAGGSVVGDQSAACSTSEAATAAGTAAGSST